MKLRFQRILKRLPLLAAALGVSLAMATKNQRFLVKSTEYKWFRVIANVATGSAVADADATYVGTGTSAPASETSNCSGSGYYCLVGFPADGGIVDANNHIITPSTPANGDYLSRSSI